MSVQIDAPAAVATYGRPLAVAGATVAALVVFAIERPLAGLDLAIRSGNSVQHIGVAAVAIASLIAGLAAWALLILIERRSARPARTWTLIASVVLLVSLTGPLSEGVGASAKLALVCLHLATAAVLIPALARSVPTTPRS